MKKLPRHLTIQKHIGETPLQALGRLRVAYSIEQNIPLTYAGRLDPMAGGKLLILIGDECKRQSSYHGLDKAYDFKILFGISSDTGDVLGVPDVCATPPITEATLRDLTESLRGEITLPYPHFSSKTVRGKPLHVWTLENRLDEIEIPTKQSRIYSLRLNGIHRKERSNLCDHILEKIETIATVTESSKNLGRDFRRDEIRSAWRKLKEQAPREIHTVASFSCVASSGTYMRSLAETMAAKLGTCGLAYSINRTTIGTYIPVFKQYGFWRTRY